MDSNVYKINRESRIRWISWGHMWMSSSPAVEKQTRVWMGAFRRRAPPDCEDLELEMSVDRAEVSCYDRNQLKRAQR